MTLLFDKGIIFAQEQKDISNIVNDLYKRVDSVRKELGYNDNKSINLDNDTIEKILEGLDIGKTKTFKDNSGEMLKHVKDIQKEYNNTIKPQIDEWQDRFRIEDGRVYIDETGKAVDKAKQNTFNNRIYIFVSSSVPTDTWKNYIYDIDKYELYENAFLVLRGCVSGCEKVHPTAEFLNPLIIKDSNNQEYYKVQAWIDPLLFRTYKITKVPCVVYAENVEVQDINLSEGLPDNLIRSSNNFRSCGDYSLKYHLKKIHEATNSSYLNDVLRKMENIDGTDFYNNDINSDN
jgi:type-F conjugative transfer system pilin assembly protein TrbC